jgi:transcriptional regulator with XRE-family HTH domain
MLGDEIRKVRLQKKMTQEQLSLATGVDRAYLSEMENGHRSPSVEVLMRLCAALGESAGILLGRVEGLDLLPGSMKGLAKLIYDENGVLTKIIDDRGRELVAEFNWIEPNATGAAEPTKLERGRPAKAPE